MLIYVVLRSVREHVSCRMALCPCRRFQGHRRDREIVSPVVRSAGNCPPGPGAPDGGNFFPFCPIFVDKAGRLTRMQPFTGVVAGIVPPEAAPSKPRMRNWRTGGAPAFGALEGGLIARGGPPKAMKTRWR